VVYTSAILITVQSSVGGTIAGSAAVCAGTNSTVLTLSGYTGSVTRWQSALAADFSGTVTNINSVSTSITETNLTATKYYRAVVRVGVCAASNSSVATVTVNALPVVSVSPSAPSITSGSSVTLTASGASTYTWTPSTGLSATNTAVVTASPTVTTTYSVSGTSSSCSSTATVTVTVTTPTPVADTDGDGVTDAQEAIDGTNPNDVCSYLVASQTLTPTSAWSTADCDGDGTPNGTDTDPKDPCVHAAGATPVTTNAIWRAADCDGDGVTNGKETDDGTDPNEGCSYVVASRTLTPSTAWGTLDCDADGNSNATDPNIDAPVASNDLVNLPSSGALTVNILTNDDFLPGANTEISRQLPPNDGTAKGTVTFNPLTGEMTYKRAPFETGLVTMGYKVINKAVSPPVSALAFVTILACDLQDPLSDCDGDGEPNGTDLAPTDPCVYEPTRQVKANVSDDWKALDCDGDGVLNGTELADGTSPSDACSFKAISITLAPSAAWLLLDCDADGVTNQVEGTQDLDGDGIPNCLDTDSDGDSISDKLETIVDTDRDGKPDYLDLDSDNDGILDSVENKVCTGTGILCDTDADGTPNFRDLDSDADQIKDVIEASGSDYNQDGIADGNIDEKGIPSSANKGLTPPDTDRDGKLDPYDVDSDGDGISDFDEEYNEVADFADCDKDGIVNRLDPDECEIFAPQGISPNNDDKNDRLVFKGLVFRKLPNHLSVYNRWGTLVFEMDDYDNSWSGTILPDGTYFYVLDFYGRKPTISNYLAIDRTIK
jgi:gliding motility-associated-like protein